MSSISVITICFNNVDELMATCESVDRQSVSPDEHWVIDGSSNADIISWLSNYPQPSYRKWVHERDKGIADAFNKGIERATSQITHILNSGDRYYSNDAIAIVKQVFGNDNTLMWTHSQYVQHRGGANVVSGAPFRKNWLWKGMRTVAHPTMFVKKELYNRYGLYDLQYKIAMDFDFLVRIRNEKFAFIPQPLIYFAPGGASNVHFKKGLAEVRKSYFTHISPSYKLVLWQLRQKALHLFMQSSVGKRWFRAKNRRKVVTN